VLQVTIIDHVFDRQSIALILLVHLRSFAVFTVLNEAADRDVVLVCFLELSHEDGLCLPRSVTQIVSNDTVLSITLVHLLLFDIQTMEHNYFVHTIGLVILLPCFLVVFD